MVRKLTLLALAVLMGVFAIAWTGSYFCPCLLMCYSDGTPSLWRVGSSASEGFITNLPVQLGKHYWLCTLQAGAIEVCAGEMLACGTGLSYRQHEMLGMKFAAEALPGGPDVFRTWRIPLYLPTVAFGVFPIVSAVRGSLLRRRRGRRGQCLTCGYDLRGTNSTACSECGAPAGVLSGQSAQST
jgi:hypothetical protein